MQAYVPTFVIPKASVKICLQFHHIISSFTSKVVCVNQRDAGKNLGFLASLKSQVTQRLEEIALSKPLRVISKITSKSSFKQTTFKKETNMNILLWRLFSAAIVLGFILLPDQVWAHDGEFFQAEITKIEGLINGGYMRLGLLGVCAGVAIIGAIKQSFWALTSGFSGCVFAYFMKGWITTTFTMVI